MKSKTESQVRIIVRMRDEVKKKRDRIEKIIEEKRKGAARIEKKEKRKADLGKRI